MVMAHAKQSAEVRSNTGFLEDFTHHSIGQVFTTLQHAAGQLEVLGKADAITLLEYNQNPAVFRHHKTASANAMRTGIGYVGACLQSLDQHHVLLAAVMQLEAQFQRLGQQFATIGRNLQPGELQAFTLPVVQRLGQCDTEITPLGR